MSRAAARLARPFLALALVVGGCRSVTEIDTPEVDAGDVPAFDGSVDATIDAAISDVDSDGDGLCDDSERSAGTDPTTPDSDGDGIPDVNEYLFGFEPVDPAVPGIDQLAFLEEEPGASVELTAHIWVQGLGDAHTGVFEAVQSAALNELSATDFNASVLAVAADPEDHAFDIDPQSARFGSVHGDTRLTFVLRFGFTDQEAVGCVRGFPFRFGVKRPDEHALVGERLYLLVVVPPGARADAENWCKPEHCI
jgi:hypothetical protein